MKVDGGILTDRASIEILSTKERELMCLPAWCTLRLLFFFATEPSILVLLNLILSTISTPSDAARTMFSSPNTSFNLMMLASRLLSLSRANNDRSTERIVKDQKNGSSSE